MTDQIPDNWKKIKLCKIGVFSTSSVDKKIDDKETYVSLLNYMDIYKNSIIKDTYNFQKVTSTEKEISSFSVKNGDVFFTPSSETPNDIGHSAVFIGDLNNLVHSYHTIRFRSKTNEYLDDTYKKYAFKGDSTYEYFRKQATGSTRFTLSLTAFNQCEVLVPPLPEQKEIASILTSVDEVIENTQKQIDKLQDLKKATMNELLTKGIGHTEFKDSELGRIPKSWNVKKLIEVGKCVRGLTFAPENVANNGLLVLRSSNIQDGSLSFKDNVFVNIKVDDYFLSKDGDILICVRNGSRQLLGKSALITGNIPISTHGAFMTVFRTDNYKFVKFLIQSDWFFTQVSRDIGATINSINNNNLLDYRFAFPLLNEQLEISKILDSIEKQIDTKKHKLSQTQFLKKSLMQDLLTGKVRVSVN